MLRRKVQKMGLQRIFLDDLLKHVTHDMFQLAKEDLRQRGYKKVGYLNELEDTVKSKKIVSM